MIEMRLDLDEFLVTYDSTRADTGLLLATIENSGYVARVLRSETKPLPTVAMTLPKGIPMLDKALARAKMENKPIVIDLYAEWCAPCRKMENLTFPDTRVRALLERTLFIRIDTDKYPDIAESLDVEGLPDIRFVLPNGKIIRQLRSYHNAKSFAGELEQLLREGLTK